ncbi:MAG: peptidylprolyl isomerase [Acidobacteria bacterium 13_1_40CM_4_58_4]|nr:MAG: peptidylprolyl isomerase [Acidobacteria bacterium 13_1_40CM_4_58_4]
MTTFPAGVFCGEGPLKTKSLFRHSLIAVYAALLLVKLTGCASKPSSDDIAAMVDGRKINRAEVEKYYENQSAGSNQQPAGEQATSMRLSILRELIDNEILMRRAEKLGLLATDEEVDRKLNEIKSPYTKEEFDARLKQKKITVDDFKRDIRRSLTVDKVLNKEVSSKINISDQDIANYYNAHKSEFNFIEPQYHLAQIWVTTTPNPQVHNLKNDKAQNEAEARTKIQMIENRLDSGDDFGTLAMNYSEDTETSGNGGDLGFTPESSLRNTDATTRETVTKLKPGQDSPIISVINPMTKQLVGFRIVKLVAKESAGQRELSDPRLRQAIRAQLQDRREQLLKAAYYEILRDQAKVENYYAQKVLDSNGAAH